VTQGLMPAGSSNRIPASPDLRRMRSDRTGRVRDVMREQGIDAVVLLGNTNVAYATGAIWPLADAGRVSFEQPVAVVLADPLRRAAAGRHAG
jgi:Xaa-Pro aminopeptidase